MDDARLGKITVSCVCGATLGVPVSAAGKRGRCPKCDSVFTVPEPDDELRVAGEDDLFAPEAPETSESESISAPSIERGGAVGVCLNCDAPMAAGAVLCVACGHNCFTGETLQGASARKADAGAGVKRLAKGAGTFALGCAFSGLGAILGAAIWSGVVLVTEFEIGWIACGLGAAAGFGMALGYKRQNLRAGVAAVVITLFGIVAAKGFTFAYFTYPDIAEASRRVTSFSFESLANLHRIAQHRSDAKARRRGLAPDDDRRDGLYEAAADATDLLTDEEIAAALAEIDRWEAGEKWDDERYVRDLVVYRMLEDSAGVAPAAVAADPPNEREVRLAAREARKKLHDARATVMAMPLADRVAKAKAIDAERTHRENANQLSWLFAMRAANKQGLSHSDARRATIQAEMFAKYNARSDEALAAGLRELEAWDQGEKWEDAEYVRDVLIYEFINEKIGEDRDGHDLDEGYEEPSAEAWQQYYTAAVERADLIPADQHVALIKARIAARDQEAEAALAAYRKGAQAELAGNVATVFFQASFNSPYDVLFIILAIWTAYGVATGKNAKQSQPPSPDGAT